MIIRLNLNGFFESANAYEKAIKIKPDYYEAHYNRGLAYIKLFELQLIQTQDFNQDLVQKFNMHDNADTTTKIFKMLTIFKSIDNLNGFFISFNGFSILF
jgi:tetratricopeptide (TPR) repeat protein